MALISNMQENLFGVPAPSAYTIISHIEIQKRDIISVKNETETPTVITKHVLKFETKTFFNEQSKNSTNAIASHGYTIPFDYDVNTNVVEYCYNFLKQNIAIYQNAIDV